MRQRQGRAVRPRWDHLDERCLPSAYTPAQITAAYGLNAITFTSSSGATVTGDGTGQTIALVETYHDPNIQASLNVFDAEYSLPQLTLTVIDQAGTQTNDQWGEEEALDVEWAHAIAPGANIVVVEASPGNNDSQGLTELMTAVQTAATQPGVTVVSMSWGMTEFSNESSYDSNFTTPGVTFIASSGDAGPVNWPACSPDVLSVGGTALNATSSGAYEFESGWAATGGGLSQYEPEPAYQESVQRLASAAPRTSPSMPIREQAFRCMTSRPTAPPGRDSGSKSAARALELPPGLESWRSSTRAEPTAAPPPLSGATQVLPALYAAQHLCLPQSRRHPGPARGLQSRNHHGELQDPDRTW